MLAVNFNFHLNLSDDISLQNYQKEEFLYLPGNGIERNMTDTTIKLMWMHYIYFSKY